jgi:quercetin dioxygenase-like cupin family protein
MLRKLEGQRTFSRFPGVDFHVLAEPQEIYDAGRLYARITIAPGKSIAYHRHDDEMESFYVARGTCRMEDNGDTVHLKEGDVLITPHGQEHAVYNDSNEPVELIALIISCKQGQPGSSVAVDRG